MEANNPGEVTQLLENWRGGEAQALEDLLPLVQGRFEVAVHDIDSREDWRLEYTARVPVVEYDGEVICQYHLDRQALTRIPGFDGPHT